MSSVVQAYPGAPNITLNGTIQEVYAQLLEINPNYDEDWKNEPSEMGTVSDAFNLWAYTLRCSPNNGVTQGPVKEGIEYLRKVRGQPHLGRGPRKCERVSCSWNTGIFWCNDVSVHFLSRRLRRRVLTWMSRTLRRVLSRHSTTLPMALRLSSAIATIR